MRRNINLIIRGKMNSDIEVEDELTPREIVEELNKNKVVNIEEDYMDTVVVRLLVSEQVIGVDTQLDFAKVLDNEIVYIEKRGL